MHITSRSGRVGEEKSIRLCFNGDPPPMAKFTERLTRGNACADTGATHTGRIKTQTYRLLLAELALRCARPRAWGRLWAV